MEFSNDNIISFIQGLIELGGANKVDDNPDKYIRSVLTGDIATIPMDDGNRKLAIYGSLATDVVIINPFAEGEANTTRATWFYHSRNILVAALIVKCMTHLIETAIRCHDKKYKETKEDHQAMKYLGKTATKIDNKLLTEFKTITESLDNFVNIYYNKKDRKCNLNGLLEKDVAQLREIYKTSGIRVSSWDYLKSIFHAVVGVKELKEYQITPQSANIPMFESFCYVYLNLFDHMQPVLDLVGIKTDVKELQGHLKYLEMYYQKAKWCASTSSVVSKAQTPAPKNTGAAKQIPTNVIAPWQYTGMPSMTAASPIPNLNMSRLPAHVVNPNGCMTQVPVSGYYATPMQQAPVVQPAQQFQQMTSAPAKQLPVSVLNTLNRANTGMNNSYYNQMPTWK